MRKAIPFLVAVFFVIPASAQVHQATPLEVLLAQLGVTHHHHDATAMPAHDMSAMSWDGSAVTTNAMPAAVASIPEKAVLQATAKTFNITARQFTFDITPSPFVVNAGDDVTLNISVPANDGSAVGHGFFVENYMSDQVSIARGRTVTIHFVATAPGTFTYLCTVTCGDGHPGMNGVMTVTAQAAAPSISSISPSTGPVSGGTAVTISGSGFASGATVTIGGGAATSVVVVNDTTITAKTPAIAPTEQIAVAKDVVVTNRDGRSATLAGAFTYTLPPPSITLIDPSGSPVEGGMVVTISGNGFSTAVATTVTFGGVAGTNVTVLSANAIRVTAPPHAAGMVDVKVTVGSNSVTSANAFTYGSTPPRRRTVRHS